MGHITSENVVICSTFGDSSSLNFWIIRSFEITPDYEMENKIDSHGSNGLPDKQALVRAEEATSLDRDEAILALFGKKQRLKVGSFRPLHSTGAHLPNWIEAIWLGISYWCNCHADDYMGSNRRVSELPTTACYSEEQLITCGLVPSSMDLRMAVRLAWSTATSLFGLAQSSNRSSWPSWLQCKSK